MAGEAVMAGEVQVVPVDHQTEFSDRGCIIKQEDWNGPLWPIDRPACSQICLPIMEIDVMSSFLVVWETMAR